MSKIKLTGHASGTGVLTVTAPNTSTDRTITLPDSTGTILDENSSLPAANLTGTVADARISTLTASKLTGALPALDGSSLTGVGVDGIVSTANATAITIDSNERVGIGETSPSGAKLTIKSTDSFPNNDAGAQLYIMDQGATSSRSAALGVRVNTVHTGTDAALITVENGSSSCNALRIDNRGTGNTFNFDGQFSMTSDGRGLSQFTAKAWVNVNCPSAVIRDSHNISSIVDQDTGRFDVNIDTNMANANYAISSGGDNSETENYVKVATWVIDAGKFNIHCHILNGTKIDLNQALAIVFGD